jgi:gluconolactonase
MNVSRRAVFAAAGAVAAFAVQQRASAQSFEFKPNQRYPDASVEILDPSFAKYRAFSSTLEQLATGMRWAEGPVWFGDGRYLLVSDIPNNRIMRFDEATGAWGVFRQPANFANGNARDRQGRLLTCEHQGRRVTRTEYDGKITVLADNFNGSVSIRLTTSYANPTARSGSPTRRSASPAIGRATRRHRSCRIPSTALLPTASLNW